MTPRAIRAGRCASLDSVRSVELIRSAFLDINALEGAAFLFRVSSYPAAPFGRCARTASTGSDFQTVALGSVCPTRSSTGVTFQLKTRTPTRNTESRGMRTIMRGRLLFLILLGHAPVASGEPTEPRLKLVESTFDGRTLSGLMLVCATSTSVHIDATFSPGVFRVIGAAACGTGAPVSGLRAYDYAGGKTRTMEVPPNTCVGRELSVRVASDDAPILGCVELEVSGLLFTAAGKTSGFVRSKIRVTARAP